MSIHSAVLVFEAGCDPTLSLSWLRVVAPELLRLRILVWASVRSGWWSQARWLQASTRLEQGAKSLKGVAVDICEDVDGDIVVEMDEAALDQSLDAVGADLLVWGPLTRNGADHSTASAARLLLHAARLRRVPQLLVGGAVGTARPPKTIACPYLGDIGQIAALGSLLGHFDRRQARILLLQLSTSSDAPADPVAMARALGLGQRIEHAHLDSGLLDLEEATLRRLAEEGADIVAVTLPTTAVLASLVLHLLVRRAAGALPFPLLLAPSSTPEAAGALTASDLLIRAEQPLQLRVEHNTLLGGPHPFNGDIELRFQGGAAGQLAVVDGRASLNDLADPIPSWVGVLTLVEAGSSGRPRVARARIYRSRSLDLVDASLPHLQSVVAALLKDAPPDRGLALVRVDPAQRLDQIRAKLPGVVVLDATVELDDGADNDLPARAHRVRLVRLARHLRSDGITIDRVAMDQAASLLGPGLQIWGVSSGQPVPPPRPDLREVRDVGIGARISARCACREWTGNRVQIELDNRQARHRWLALIEEARRSIRLQTYIIEDDIVAETVLAALARAAARGLSVRVLVDSVASRLRGNGTTNPLLDRLAEVPGITLREIRPVTGIPGIDDIKLRCHRKLLLIDGRVALVTGRNLGAQYLRGFDEVLVSPKTPGGAIPWMDAGARLEGPVVAEAEAAFLASWVQSGGQSYSLPHRTAAVGSATVRLVLHDGMRDAHTLDAYRTLIDLARHSLWLANTFPLQQELLRALLRALARGVSVHVLVGNVRPVYCTVQGKRVPFPSSGSMRELATQVIHGRLDALAQAGAVVGELACSTLPGWDPAAGPVRPHVHAKLMVADSRWIAVGSANLDVTAGYWESEILAIIDSSTTALSLEHQLHDLIDASVPFDPTDPAWQALAQRRAWLSANWPSLVG